MSDPWSIPDVPRPLTRPLTTVLHPDSIDTDGDHTLAVAVANWAETAQPASRRAKPKAEPYLGGHLAAAVVVGRATGKRVALRVVGPIAVALFAIAVLIMTIR